MAPPDTEIEDHPGPSASRTRQMNRRSSTSHSCRPLFDNAKKLRALLSELQDLTLEIIETGSPGQHHQNPEPETRGPEIVA
jgi:hypothetical protein